MHCVWTPKSIDNIISYFWRLFLILSLSADSKPPTFSLLLLWHSPHDSFFVFSILDLVPSGLSFRAWGFFFTVGLLLNSNYCMYVWFKCFSYCSKALGFLFGSLNLEYQFLQLQFSMEIFQPYIYPLYYSHSPIWRLLPLAHVLDLFTVCRIIETSWSHIILCFSVWNFCCILLRLGHHIHLRLFWPSDQDRATWDNQG